MNETRNNINPRELIFVQTSRGQDRWHLGLLRSEHAEPCYPKPPPVWKICSDLSRLPEPCLGIIDSKGFSNQSTSAVERKVSCHMLTSVCLCPGTI
jgi:hypothetical protein